MSITRTLDLALHVQRDYGVLNKFLGSTATGSPPYTVVMMSVHVWGARASNGLYQARWLHPADLFEAAA
jgi:hypothetical protein